MDDEMDYRCEERFEEIRRNTKDMNYWVEDRESSLI